MVPFVKYVVLTFESVDEILWCYHSNETSSAVLSHGTIYLVCSSNVWVRERNLLMWLLKWNFFGCTFTWYYSFFSILKNEIWIFLSMQFCLRLLHFRGERVKRMLFHLSVVGLVSSPLLYWDLFTHHYASVCVFFLKSSGLFWCS